MRRPGTRSRAGSCDALDHGPRGVEIEARLGAVARVDEALGDRLAGANTGQGGVELELGPDHEQVAEVAGPTRLLGRDQGLVELLARPDPDRGARHARR